MLVIDENSKGPDNKSMLFIQRYFSLKDIEMEFQQSLENLLIHEVPNINWLIQQEGLAQKLKSSTSFYFLFFCEKHNDPVGFAQINLYDLPVRPFLNAPQRLYYKCWRKKTQWKILSCKIHGPSNPGYIYHPLYQKEGIIELKKIIRDLHKQYSIVLEVLNHDYEVAAPTITPNPFSYTQVIPHVLYKSYKDYHSYLKSLGEQNSHRIKSLWKSLENNPQIHIHEYSSLLQIFQTFPSLLEEENLINHNLYPLYQHVQGIFLTFQTPKKILGLIIMVEGQGGHLFCDLFCSFQKKGKANSDLGLGHGEDTIISPSFLGQYAIKIFFEMEAYKRLHFLHPPQDSKGSYSYLKNIGLSSKKQLISVHPRTSVVHKNWQFIKDHYLPILN